MKQYNILREKCLKVFIEYISATNKAERKEIAERYKFWHGQLRMCATIYGIDIETNLLTFKPA